MSCIFQTFSFPTFSVFLQRSVRNLIGIFKRFTIWGELGTRLGVGETGGDWDSYISCRSMVETLRWIYLFLVRSAVHGTSPALEMTFVQENCSSYSIATYYAIECRADWPSKACGAWFWSCQEAFPLFPSVKPRLASCIPLQTFARIFPSAFMLLVVWAL